MAAIRGKVMDEIVLSDSENDVSNDQDSVIIVSPGPSVPSTKLRGTKKRPLSATEQDNLDLSPLTIEDPLSPLGRATHVSLSILERRSSEMKKLADEYGEEDNGWGFKVFTKPINQHTVPVAFSLCVLPVLNRHTPNDAGNSFKLVVVEAVEGGYRQQEGGEEFRGFPPIRLRGEFAGPASFAIKFILSCSWLPRDHTKKLIKEMQRHYIKHNNSVVKTVEWLEMKSVKELAIIFRRRRLYYISPAVPEADRRALTDTFHIAFHDPHSMFALFRSHAAKVDACQSVGLDIRRAFDCDICFDHRPALAALIFTGCGHYFCRMCVGQDLSIKIKEAVLELTCPAKDCKSKVEVALLRTLVERDVFQRFCDLTADVFVDNSVSMVRCPRQACGAPMELQPDSPREVACMTCSHPFCSTCKNAPHPGTPCLTDEQKKQIREEWAVADDEKKEQMRRQYGADNIKFALEDAESQNWISQHAKPCPACRTPIEKVDGCNKMVCTTKGCRTFFCWLCLTVLPATNPYSHFSDPNIPCANRLHEGNGHHNPAAYGLAFRARAPGMAAGPRQNPGQMARMAMALQANVQQRMARHRMARRAPARAPMPPPMAPAPAPQNIPVVMRMPPPLRVPPPMLMGPMVHVQPVRFHGGPMMLGMPLPPGHHQMHLHMQMNNYFHPHAQPAPAPQYQPQPPAAHHHLQNIHLNQQHPFLNDQEYQNLLDDIDAFVQEDM